jgi:hypothetical protein
LGQTLSSDPIAGPFVAQAPNYTSWYMADKTYDDGINDQINKYYADAINAINGGSTVASVVKTLDDGVQQVLAKYPEAK